MYQKFLFFLTLYFCSTAIFAQINGRVVSDKGIPLENVALFFENTQLLAFTDKYGNFELETPKRKSNLFIQREGYNTKKINWSKNYSTNNIEFSINNTANEPRLFSTKDKDPFALFIIKAASKNRLEKDTLQKFTVDFYSKGALQLDSERETFLGQKRRDLDPTLDADSLNNNYIYLSELKSTLTFKKPDDFKEEVIAHQESGNIKDLEYLTGSDSNFDFYKKDVSTSLKIISPLAPIAPSYYYFELTNSWQDSYGHTIYQIQVTPKRENEPVMNGYIYIVKDSWKIYAVDAKLKADNLGITKVNQFHLRQYYTFDPTLNIWKKDNQTLDLKGKFLVFDYTGKFQSKLTNYQIDEKISKKDFTRELVSFKPNYDKKKKDFWLANRTIPLTDIETQNFEYKSFMEKESTQVVLDSIDKRTNNFTLFKLIKGYRYQNTFKNRNYTYRGLLSTFAFNPVQGFNVTTGLAFTQNRLDDRKTELGVLLNYGIEENRPRFSGYASHVFNKKNYNTLNISGGTIVEQFGEDQAPIKNIINSLSASWFGKNFAKYYQKDFVKIAYEQYAFTGLKIQTSFEFASRIPLFNQVVSPPFVPHLNFSSNNPKDENNFTDSPFEANNIFKFKLGVDIVFDQKIISYPNQKQYIPNSKYPILSLKIEKGLSSSISKYNYTFLSISTQYNSSIGSIGNLSFGFDTGKFIEKNDIAFMDYKHFYGNQTPIGSNAIYNKQFNLLPYYDYSTSKSYVEYHIEHDFKGFLMNKIPLLSKTRFSFVLGFHQLTVADKPTYQEYSIGLNNFGFGKFRPFRIDYFRSHHNASFKTQGVIIGVKILDLIQK